MVGHYENTYYIKMIQITLKQKIAATPLQVRDALLDHAQLERFFNAKFVLLKKQNEGEIIGGKGAIRQVIMAGVRFEERIISADSNHISYQIIGNKPVAEHRGDIYFCVSDNAPTSTEVTYNIRCKTPWWLPSLVIKFFIKKDIAQALNKLKANFKGNIS
ncbi:hypothetical protein PNIG_a0683 [Pseudoalteromonas nigrifaciens]|uniref:Polyketide cyclase / dehydrase and lipid transport n=2 Tax=Pseudoalteromonas TaxID=53246 RepID=A0AAC9XWT5_9GAMM|nr:hypothetical protein PNIG_a0683 [Pseudoalteromonas nigrifaciens]GEN43926.1 hypothetical protein PNI02_33920 [Pseudoalteromonas nigrifaciens]SUC53163.1 Polyketide cyclase / dehydrase and lipid transport [Pseudoalteromonas nigrifaciens]|tara:strand:+ start:663 stop:1142 length:480 start_codon:yes stop_codon:yes gene_type:complete